MQVELKRMHRELGVTMIYVTHDQTEAMTMSDRIAVFNHGRIEQCGTPDEIYFSPKTRFVAGFVGDSNLIEATSRGGGLFDTALGPVRAARGDVPAGSAAALLLRPEMITAARDAGAGMVPVQVETEMNYGDSLLLIGRAGQGMQPLRIRVPGTALHAMQGAATVHAGWAPEHVHVVL
jgi:putative spermidine/putrescine transport system ATP-binding protein